MTERDNPSDSDDRGGAAPEAAGQPGQPGQPQPSEHPSFFSDFVDLVYGIFFSPVKTLREAAARARAPFGASLFAFLLVVLINGLAGAATARTVWQGFFEGFIGTLRAGGLGGAAGAVPSAAPSGIILVMVAIGLLWGPIGLFFKTGALSLMSSFLGGRGQPSRLFAAFGLTYVPSLVGIPFTLVLGGRPGLAALGAVIGLAILVWRLILDIVAIREVNGFDTGRAVAAALVPLGALVVLALLVVMLWLIGFAAILGPLLQSGIPGVG